MYSRAFRTLADFENFRRGITIGRGTVVVVVRARHRHGVFLGCYVVSETREIRDARAILRPVGDVARRRIA
jgi:hypothetical protein